MSFRRNTSGEPTSFLIYHPTEKKNKRYTIPKEYRTEELAKEYRKKIELKLGILQQRAKKRFEFINKYKNQEDLFNEFMKYREKIRPRSYYEEGSRLKNYTFPFFIGEMNLNHPSKWYTYWNEFHEHLNNKTLRNNMKGQFLAVNTKNNIVKVTNIFISFVEQKEATGDLIPRIPEFKHEEKGRRGIESVYTEDDFNKVLEKIKYPLIFETLYHTGMRVNEVLSLEKKDIIIGKLPSEKWIFKTLEDHNVKSFGYILLKHQYDKKGKKIPLKGRRKVSPEHNRVIPLTDKNFTTQLLTHINNFQQTDRIFSITYRNLYSDFFRVKNEVKLSKEKDIHSIRHTFTTRFVRMCGGDPRVVEKVLGHSNKRITQVYNHLAQEMESNSIEGISDPNLIEPLKVG